jgi:hypothetical protein
MHVTPRRKPGAEVEELRDPGIGGQELYRPAEELAVLPRQQRHLRRGLDHLERGDPVGGEVIVAAQVVVVHAGGRGNRRVDAGRRLPVICHCGTPYPEIYST